MKIEEQCLFGNIIKNREQKTRTLNHNSFWRSSHFSEKWAFHPKSHHHGNQWYWRLVVLDLTAQDIIEHCGCVKTWTNWNGWSQFKLFLWHNSDFHVPLTLWRRYLLYSTWHFRTRSTILDRKFTHTASKYPNFKILNLFTCMCKVKNSSE